MIPFVSSDFKLGIISGGQLGKLLIQAASKWDIYTAVLDADPDAPASAICNRFVQGSHHDYDAVLRFGRTVDMITFEIEHINIDALKKLQQEGVKIYPDPEILALVQDKGSQKLFYKENGIPTSPFRLYANEQEITEAIHAGEIVYPFVQKLRRGGYDGRGVSVIYSPESLSQLLAGPSVIEQMVKIKKEISVIVSRNMNDEVVSFPVAEMEFNPKANLVEYIICPSELPELLLQKAVTIAESLIRKMDMVGLLAVEMFVDSEDNILVNEVAPRPHNSGHHTVEASPASQYEQLLRAILNFPPGDTSLIRPAVMINLLGEQGFEGKVDYAGLEECMRIPGASIHLYGKKITKPFRKMGHATVTAPTIGEAIVKAEFIKQTLKVISR